MSAEIWVLVPIAAMGVGVLTIWLITRYLIARAQAQASPDGQYKKLAEEAVRGQKEILAQSKKLADRVAEIERLLKEV